MRILLILVLLINGKAIAQTSTIADSLYATGNYVKAINSYAKVGSINSILQTARAYNTIGNFDKAIVQYQDVISKDSTLQIAPFELAKLYLKVKRPKDALPLFSNLVSSGGENPEYLYFQGEAFGALGEEKKSVVSYQRAITIDSTHLRSLFRLAKYYIVQAENNKALDYIDLGLDFYENDLSLINLKALAHFNNDAFEKAIPWFEKLIAMGETKAFIYKKLAHCYFKAWDFEKAKNIYYILLGIDDTDADAYFNLGHTFWKDKQLDSAQIFIEKSIEVQDPILDREYNALAGLARELGDLKSALEYYKLAYAEDPENPRGYYQICTVADRLYKDPKLKLAHYEKFIDMYGKDKFYFSKFVSKRISELKEEIHFAQE